MRRLEGSYSDHCYYFRYCEPLRQKGICSNEREIYIPRENAIRFFAERENRIAAFETLGRGYLRTLAIIPTRLRCGSEFEYCT